MSKRRPIRKQLSLDLQIAIMLENHAEKTNQAQSHIAEKAIKEYLLNKKEGKNEKVQK